MMQKTLGVAKPTWGAGNFKHSLAFAVFQLKTRLVINSFVAHCQPEQIPRDRNISEPLLRLLRASR